MKGRHNISCFRACRRRGWLAGLFFVCLCGQARAVEITADPVNGSIGIGSKKPLVRVASKHQPCPQLRDLGTVKRGETAVSAEREIFNRRKTTETANGVVYEKLFHGTAHRRTPDEKRPDPQENDFTGIVLAGVNAAKFSLEGAFPVAASTIKLLRGHGEPGLRGGPDPDRLQFAVRFSGASEPGAYQASVRIVTQAANTGTLSTGTEGEPSQKLYSTDIPVTITVKR